MPIIDPIGPTVSGESSDHSIQAFIELVYVRKANDILVQKMNDLDAQLGITQDAINLLTRVQDLHNAVKVNDRTGITVNNTWHGGDDGDDYQDLASAKYGKALSVAPDYTDWGTSANFRAVLSQVKGQISDLIPRLASMTPSDGHGSVDATSLLAKLRIVLQDITSTNATSNPRSWLVDNYNSSSASSNQGKFQQHITEAITAGQSLNTTQTTAVRNYLYLYEEYYKSASAVLTAISQMIQKMAGGIAR